MPPRTEFWGNEYLSMVGLRELQPTQYTYQFFKSLEKWYDNNLLVLQTAKDLTDEMQNFQLYSNFAETCKGTLIAQVEQLITETDGDIFQSDFAKTYMNYFQKILTYLLTLSQYPDFCIKNMCIKSPKKIGSSVCAPNLRQIEEMFFTPSELNWLASGLLMRFQNEFNAPPNADDIFENDEEKALQKIFLPAFNEASTVASGIILIQERSVKHKGNLAYMHDQRFKDKQPYYNLLTGDLISADDYNSSTLPEEKLSCEMYNSISGSNSISNSNPFIDNPFANNPFYDSSGGKKKRRFTTKKHRTKKHRFTTKKHRFTTKKHRFTTKKHRFTTKKHRFTTKKRRFTTKKSKN
jgi:hypothetical protein